MIVALAILFLASSCSKNDVDLAKGIDPRITPDNTLIQTLADISSAPDDQARMEIISETPSLNSKIITYAKELGQIRENAHIDSLVYYFGSAEAQAEDKSGKIFDGKIIDETVAFIYHDGSKEPFAVIVYCQNGMFGPMNELRRLGRANLAFVIGKGEGLNRYVDYQTSIMLAEYFNIPIYRGRQMNQSNLISGDEALSLESSLDQLQVTVKVYQGDQFDIGKMTYRPANR